MKSLEQEPSDQDQEHPRRFPSLGLDKEQLMQRLNTLKDYPTFKKTKGRRINLKTIVEKEQTPIIDTALAFGSRDSEQLVLKEYIKQHSEKVGEQNLNRFQEMVENNRRKRKKPKLSQEDPSFICYKSSEEKERPKISKMVNSQEKGKSRPSKEELSPKECHSPRKPVSFPRELGEMKHKLMMLPVLHPRTPTRYNPEQFDDSLSPSSPLHDE